MYEIWDRPLDPRIVEKAVLQDDKGAIVTFIGIVRNHSRGQPIQYLEYEAYKPMAEAAFREIGEEILSKWGLPCAILHRVGHLEVGEASVIISVAAPHRRDAFDACEYAIDQLKQTAPIWKKEVSQTGEWWVEGETIQMRTAAVIAGLSTDR